jgi:dTDP-4-dehydrorhamnose 3,5-epimerase
LADIDEPAWLLDGARRDAQSMTKDWVRQGQELLHGVVLKDVLPVVTGYGHLTEVLRGEWLGSNRKVDQVFVTTMLPGAVSAWHAHSETTDRLFVAAGFLRVVLYDNRDNSPSKGRINEFRLAPMRPALVVIPPRVWHGVQNMGAEPAILINAVDHAYRYEDPDHWRVPPDSPNVPFAFS